jgi:co-chaperonin GroES (HSP10)
MKLQGKNVLIKPEEINKTSGGLHLSTLTKKAPIGKVLDTGPGCEKVKTGDRVHYVRRRAHRIQIEGIEHHFLFEDDVSYIY